MDYKVMIKQAAIDGNSYFKNKAKADIPYLLIGTINDKLLVVVEDGEIIEVYPKNVKFVA